MPALTALPLKLAFDETSVMDPWSIEADETGGGWQTAYQNWGLVVIEESATGNERAITVQMAMQTRERLEVLVTVVGVGVVVWKAETVRTQELDLAVNRLINTLLAQ
ncbi:MAG TPA: hypothetical protein VGN17_26185 [Bryobacteraceae bacterium]|jgi:hypothetical protein